MPIMLLIAAIVIFACVMLNRVSDKLGIPTLLAFILLGMAFGTDGFLKIPFDNYAFAEQICSVALIFIMFYGGFGTNWKRARPVAPQAILLSTVGVLGTAAITGLFCYMVLDFSLLEGLLVGSVISSTDAASVFSILRARRLNLKYNTASLLELESGSNDPCSYMLTAVFISAIGSGGVSAGSVVLMLVKQLGFGLLFGVGIAVLAAIVLKKGRIKGEGFNTIFVVGVAIISFAAPAALGGNGYLSAYIVGIVLGNAEIPEKRKLVHFFDGMTGLTQMLIFFLLGLLAFPSRLPEVALIALLIALFLTFIARPIMVFAIMSPFRSKITQQLLVSWSGLRGAASIVFAIMAVMAVDNIEHDLFHIVFFIVLFSILFQGSLITPLARKCGMIDDKTDVMKTFNDYTEEMPVQYIQFAIPENHTWCNVPLSKITLPPETLLVLLKRQGKSIVPHGRTKLQAGDIVILSAASPERIEGLCLSEIYIDEEHEYAGKNVSEISNDSAVLIIMVQRRGKVIIPRGGFRLQAGDTLVVNHGVI